MPHTRARYILDIISKKLNFQRVVVIQGARQTGKSYLLRSLAAKTGGFFKYLTFDQETQKLFAESNPETFLKQHQDVKTLMIDEAQKVPAIFDAVKFAVDENRRPGMYILAGSTEFSKKTLIRESLTGRVTAARMYPFTASEALQLPNNTKDCSVNFRKKCTRSDFLRHLFQGGMPGMFSVRDEREHEQLLKDWLETTVYRDLMTLPKVKLDPNLAMQILERIATLEEPSASHIAKALRRDLRTIKKHLDALEILFVLHKLHPHPLSTGKPIYFLCDVALARYFEANFAKQLYTWAVQEALARQTWCSNIKEKLYFYRTARGSFIHLIVVSSSKKILALKIISVERVTELDLIILKKFGEKMSDLTCTLKALGPLEMTSGTVEVIPWEDFV